MKLLLIILLVRAVLSQLFCSNNGQYYEPTDKCYHFIDIQMSLQDGLSTCLMFNALPVSIEGSFEQTFIEGQAAKYFPMTDFWIGLIDSRNTNHFTWVDGSSSYFRNWATGFPQYNSNRSCVAVQSSTGKWYNINCEDKSIKKYILCQSLREVNTDSCPDPSIRSRSNNCYQMIPVPQTFNSASLICKRFGHELPSIQNTLQQSDLTVIAKQHFYETDYWIGLSDQIDSGDYRWPDGTVTNFTNWAQFYPDVVRDHLCVAGELRTGKWYNTDCDETKKAFLCERPKHTVDAWQYLASTKAYYKGFYNETSVTKAEELCLLDGGHLASVHSNIENTFVSSFADALDDYIAIGISLNKTSLKWTDESPVDYENWYASKPSSYSPCAVISADSLKWRIIPCTSFTFTYQVVCKKSIEDFKKCEINNCLP